MMVQNSDRLFWTHKHFITETLKVLILRKNIVHEQAVGMLST